MWSRSKSALLALILLLASSSLACFGVGTSATPTPTAAPAASKAVVPPGAATAFPSKPGQAFAVTITEKQMNDSLAQSLKDAPNAPISNAHVTLQPGKAILTGRAQIGPFNSEVTISGTVAVSGAKPTLQILDVTAGVPVPGFVTAALSGQLNAAFSSSITDLPAEISAVEIRQGEMLIVGTSR